MVRYSFSKNAFGWFNHEMMCASQNAMAEIGMGISVVQLLLAAKKIVEMPTLFRSDVKSDTDFCVPG